MDRWILANLQQAATLHADRNRDWCVTGFVEKNRDLFAGRFPPEVVASICPGPGGTILCASMQAHARCLGVLGGLIGHGEECAVDVAKVGLEGAREIKTKLQELGSNQALHPCHIVPSTGQGDPPDLACPRPTQGVYCQGIYRERFGGFPMQLLDCRVNRLADYAALESKVASEAARLAKQHGVALRVEKEGDPLVVHVTGLAALRKIEPHVADLGFGPPCASPGFYFSFDRQNQNL